MPRSESKKPMTMTKKLFMALAITMISGDPNLSGLWLGESAAKVVKLHAFGSTMRSDAEMKETLRKVLYMLRAHTKREVTRKTLEAAGLCVVAEPSSDQANYAVKKIIAHDYTKDGCMATVRWEDTCEPMRVLPRSVVRAYFRKCIGPGSAFERRYVEAEAGPQVLVPGYGKCWVHPDVAHDRYSSSFHEYCGITELGLVTQVAKSSTDKVFIQLFQLIGHDLVDLTIQMNLLREHGLCSILRSCPNLRKLQLNGDQVEDMFAFTHGYDVGYCQIESLSIENFRVNPKSLDEFAKVLGDPDREAAKHLRRLYVGKLRVQDIDIAVVSYEEMVESFV